MRFLLGINPTWSDKRMVRRGKIIPDLNIQHIQLSITPRVKQPCEEKFRRSVCSLNLNELPVIGLATKVERADRCVLEISRAPPFCLILSRFHGKESRRLRPTISFPPPPPPPSQFEFELALFHDVEKDFLRLFPRTTWKEFLSSVFERGGATSSRSCSLSAEFT